MHGSNISVVVPIYNEAGLVDDLISHVTVLGAREVIIVDGGSADGTWERLKVKEEPAQGVRALRAATGRSPQMNTGALHATADILLFLHADTRLPRRALERINEALDARPARRWGRFDVQFDHTGPLLGLVAWSMNRRSALSSICTGDQALFVYREDFLRAGGFAPVALMEDVELSRRLKRRSRPLRIRPPATTSARRWRERGTLRTIVFMWRLRWLYWWGVPTSVLSARYYPDR